MRLGQEVLIKIQNLLTNIQDSKQSSPRQKPFPLKKEKSQSFIKLYEDHKKKKKQNQENEQAKYHEEMKQNVPFKIVNKHTIFLNSIKKRPPLHQRLQQIELKKRIEMERLREKYPPTKTKQELEKQEEEAIENYLEERSRSQKKYTQKQAQQKVQELMGKERRRVAHMNMLKIRTIEEHSRSFRKKPYVGKATQNVWNQHRLKKQLSSSVFQRFQQYQMERKTRLETKEREVKQMVTPFAPKISDLSRRLASKSSSRANLHQELSRSCSCKCFQRSRVKGQNSTLQSSHIK